MTQKIYSVKCHFNLLLFIKLIAGDLYNEEQLLNWLLTQKDPSGEVIEALQGDELRRLIASDESVAVYFCELNNVVAVDLELLYSNENEISCSTSYQRHSCI